MVYRVYVEKKPELAHEAKKLFQSSVDINETDEEGKITLKDLNNETIKNSMKKFPQTFSNSESGRSTRKTEIAKEYGIDELLREKVKSDCVIAGISAGDHPVKV